MTVLNLVLPITAVIITGWLAGYFNYISRQIADGLIHFAYNVAMPALLFGTLAQENLDSLLAWRFLLAFGVGALICFAAVYMASRGSGHREVRSRAMYGLSASMTNTAFVALPILHRLYGPHGVLPAAIATMFVALVMFPIAVVLLQREDGRKSPRSWSLVRQVVLNPLVLSTALGIAWAIGGLPIPSPVDAFLRIFGDALTACALFALGLSLSLSGIRANLRASLQIAVVKLALMPALVWGLSRLVGLGDFYTVSAVVCAAVPTAKTAYILSRENDCEEELVASTISLTTVLSTVTLVFWLYLLPSIA